ncbi:Nsp1-like C-terminal region-domain-containing protein [Gautieria morchelliformis]|nr:Nsp1-like C-terminal region-domain-containing protein [Gautieria morchelliformis]
MLRGKTVEDIVNRWTTELETHTREFSHLASEVAVWDRTLIENGNYISALYATVLAAELTQASLDQSLDHVEQQQRHLTATLDQYEKPASEILHGPGGIMSSTEGLGLADSERDKSYALPANLYTQLDDLSRSLTQMVESVNCLNLSPGPSHSSGTADEGSQEDAISTIAGILNAHLSSLQWINGSLKEMEGKVNDVERNIKDTGGRGWSSSGTGEGTNKGRSYGLGTSRR